jgi:hypothetical protein
MPVAAQPEVVYLELASNNQKLAEQQPGMENERALSDSVTPNTDVIHVDSGRVSLGGDNDTPITKLHDQTFNTHKHVGFKESDQSISSHISALKQLQQ